MRRGRGGGWGGGGGGSRTGECRRKRREGGGTVTQTMLQCKCHRSRSTLVTSADLAEPRFCRLCATPRCNCIRVYIHTPSISGGQRHIINAAMDVLHGTRLYRYTARRDQLIAHIHSARIAPSLTCNLPFSVLWS